MSVSSEGSARGMSNVLNGDDSRTDAAALNSRKRTFASDDPPDQQLSLTEKKLRRLEKNRISARECRRRKREATEQKLRQINLLEAENLRLRLQLEIGQQGESPSGAAGEESSSKQQNTIMQELDDLLTSGASEADIYDKLEDYKNKYSDYGTSRRSSIESHLRQIERLLMPTQTTSVVMTAIQAGPFDIDLTTAKMLPAIDGQSILVSSPLGTSSVTTATTQTTELTNLTDAPTLQSNEAPTASKQNIESKALFHHLVNYLQVTPQQAAALKDSRFVAKELDECLEKALEVLQELRTRLAKTGEDLANEFDQVRKTLTPTQAAKFLVWVVNNKACIHMLNELWDRVYPNQNIFQDDVVQANAAETIKIPSANNGNK
ncbi:hypothetical protein MPSEU_000291800 [Mayamaea pseudoterrestris]|nr:hypothetical protein MPSEU_000291800 [Mayamaea pseudoterrestris]